MTSAFDKDKEFPVPERGSNPTAQTPKRSRCQKEDVIAIVVVIITILHVALLAAASVLPAMNAPPLPSFEDPIKGFEPRGTDTSNRIKTLDNRRWSGLDQWPTRQSTQPKIQAPPSSRKRRNLRQLFSSCDFTNNAAIAFESTSGKSLFNARSFKAMCHLEEKVIRSNTRFNSLCLKGYVNGTYKCCPSWSLGNLVALATRKSSCQAITDQDVNGATQLLKMCAPFLAKGLLKRSCKCSRSFNGSVNNNCPRVPCPCFGENHAVLITLTYLTDSKFLSTPSDTFLKYSLVFSPLDWSQYDFYDDVYKKHVRDSLPEYDGVKIVGFSFGNFKFDLFNILLIENAKYPAIAMAVLLIIMCLYLNSIILSFCALLTIIFALVDSYFLYNVVFGIKFFPFLNVMALVFIVGIGADDAFVYYDIWRQTKENFPNANCITLTLKTLRYAALSMFVTSCTTSAAFLSSYSSHITSIKCFGIYGGLTILTNYLLMVTWFPAVVVLHERWVRKRNVHQNPPNDSITIREEPASESINRQERSGSKGEQSGTEQNPLQLQESPKDSYGEQHQSTQNITKDITPSTRNLACLVCWGMDFPCHFLPFVNSFFRKLCSKLFEHWLPNAVLKMRLYFVWIFLFVGLTVGFLCVNFVKPGMSLPSSKDFQVFASSSTLEQFDLKIKNNFRYAQVQGWGMMISIVWGVKATDNGDHLNPNDLGTLEFDNSFDPFTPKSQEWLMSFSSRVRNQSFYSKTKNRQELRPFERFYSLCSSSNQSTCCMNYTFPYPKDVFERCYISAGLYNDGIYFDKNTGKVKAMRWGFVTDTSWTAAYGPMDKFWNEINSWAKEQFSNAPAGVKNGWIGCESLDFYSLQWGLFKGTFSSMSISVAIAFAVMLLTTLNIFISLYAIATIIGIIALTVGCLVLLGWQLNILESIVMSVAVGLSIDFTMHYGVAYRLSPHKESREERVRYSFAHIGSPIFMAALTTFLTGLLMMPAIVLVYNQLGQFLMLLMVFSWLFATFAFQSLCAVIGPVGNFGQLSITKLCRGPCNVQPDDSQVLVPSTEKNLELGSRVTTKLSAVEPEKQVEGISNGGGQETVL